jgi:hypothetical protein
MPVLPPRPFGWAKYAHTPAGTPKLRPCLYRLTSYSKSADSSAQCLHAKSSNSRADDVIYIRYFMHVAVFAVFEVYCP